MFRSRFSLLPFALILSLPARSVAATKPNVILITLGSVRADRVGFLDSKQPTPNLDALAKQGIVFERAYAQAPLTVVSDATILSGTYPQTHGATELGAPVSADSPWLPDVLRLRGYQTAAFVGTTSLDPKSGFASGFSRSFESYDASGRAAQISRISAWLNREHTPFFVWANIAPGPANSAGSPADTSVGKLLASLKAS